jgi:hypothetical protein
MEIEIKMSKEEFTSLLKSTVLPGIPTNCELIDVESAGYPVKNFTLKLETGKGRETK